MPVSAIPTLPSSQGLHIGRRFTTTGEDMFSSFTFVYRDAIVRDYKTGEIKFQLRVEVPDDWEQGAVDVLASKYCRKAGVPHYGEDSEMFPELGPERSAKQVVARMANAWMIWGRRGGYFASDSDAEAFRDEIGFMIMNQMAAPNSPQWFNTGLFEAYGLMEDPDGNSYYDPALGEVVSSQHKYERSTANACFPEGTLITTRSGTRPIEKIEPGDVVLTHQGRWREVSATMQRLADTLVTIEVQKNSARPLRATPEHPVLAFRQADVDDTPRHGTAHLEAAFAALMPAWIEAGSLAVGDYVVTEPAMSSNEAVPAALTIGRHAVSPVVATSRESFGGTVYNFHVDEDETYVAEGIVVHNCFILSVSDKLVGPDSIMNLIEREARLFKGGSGAGSNVSAIRGKNEKLTGGGTSSGVMSFLRPIDRAAGAIKCLAANTRVLTDRGHVPIAEVAPGDKVPTRAGWRDVLARHDNGIRSVVKVTTQMGDEIVCTPEHRFWVCSDSGAESWKQAGAIALGDTVLLDLSAPDSSTIQELVPVTIGHHDEQDSELPTHMTEDFALWLGLMHGDGCIINEDVAQSFSWQVTSTDSDLDRTVSELTAHLFVGTHVSLHRRTTKPDASSARSFHSSKLSRLIAANGLTKDPASTTPVPEVVWRSPAPVRAAFLRGLFETDGFVSDGCPVFATSSPHLASEVRRLLISLGIPTHTMSPTDQEAACGATPRHEIRILSSEGVGRFAEIVGFVSTRKTAAMTTAAAHKFANRSGPAWTLLGSDVALDELFHEGDAAETTMSPPYGRYASPPGVSVVAAKQLRAGGVDLLERPEVTAFAEATTMWVSVTVEPAGETHVYDIEIDDTHEYLAQGLRTHNSGGTTRRAAKMVILNLDHPEIEEFIWCKVEQEKVVAALINAGYDSGWDTPGGAYDRADFQNANHSVRIPAGFLQKLIADGDIELIGRKDGAVLATHKARALWDAIATASWTCADPGIQFDGIINDWATTPADGRINGSNPCFTGDTLVHTDRGLIRFDDLLARSQRGESFQVYTHDATNADTPDSAMHLTTPQAVMVTGTNEICRLDFDNGMALRCTAGHRIWTTNRGYVEAQDLATTDEVLSLDLPTPAVAASWGFQLAKGARVAPGDVVISRYLSKLVRTELPEKWTPELGHLLGWLVGDNNMSVNHANMRTNSALTLVYGSSDEAASFLPAHRTTLEAILGADATTRVVMEDGTVQLRTNRRCLVDFFSDLGVSIAHASAQDVPAAILEAPVEVQAAFLRGLFDSDGCTTELANGTRYVGLGSSSPELLRAVQRLVSTFGIGARIHTGGAAAPGVSLSPTVSDTTVSDTTVHDEERSCDTKPVGYLCISGEDIPRFASAIGFDHPNKAARLAEWLQAPRFNSSPQTTRLVARVDDGVEVTYNLSESRNHSYVANGIVVRNCSEYLHVDNTACNLASINLAKFFDADAQVFDTDTFEHAVRIWTTALEITVSMSHYPSEEIAFNSFEHRTLGLGFANLGALLMRAALPYDSREGRAVMGAISALMTSRAYATSAEMASMVGPCAAYARNVEATNRVLRNHRRAAYGSDRGRVALGDYESLEVTPVEIDHRILARTVFSNLTAPVEAAADEMVAAVRESGVRNSQATVIAPTGCLVPGSLVTTDHGLVRLGDLGNTEGASWQDVDLAVQTDEGPRQATKFFVNGLSDTVELRTQGGHTITGTPEHRTKVVLANGTWAWRRFAEVAPGDLVPLALGQLFGEPHQVRMPVGPQELDRHDVVGEFPQTMTPELAELAGLFMGNGSLHGQGLRFESATLDGIDGIDLDVIERLRVLAKSVFAMPISIDSAMPISIDSATLAGQTVLIHSVRLAQWWEDAALAKVPDETLPGRGFCVPRIPPAVLWSNDPVIYSSFLRGLFEANGVISASGISLVTTTQRLADEVQALCLALGYMTGRGSSTGNHLGLPVYHVDLLSGPSEARWLDEVGFVSGHKQRLAKATATATAKKDWVPLPSSLVDELLPSLPRDDRDADASSLRSAIRAAIKGHGVVQRSLVQRLADMTDDARVHHLLGFFYDKVVSSADGGYQPTYDLSVPNNVTYIANGFVSHNTIGLVMSCDTTGPEPDFALVKWKKLAGGGMMKIVNRSVEPALRALGYNEAVIVGIITHALGTASLTSAMAVSYQALALAGVPEETLAAVEVGLSTAPNLALAFAPFAVGDELYVAHGLDPATASGTDLLLALGFTVEEIVASSLAVCGHETLEGAPGLREEDLAVFDTANYCGDGTRVISWRGHVEALGAIQPHVSGGISKTINMPHDATIDDVRKAHELSYTLGVKCVAVYRDGCKLSQPLNRNLDDAEVDDEGVPIVAHPSLPEITRGMSPRDYYGESNPPRFKLPSVRTSKTFSLNVGGMNVYVTAGEFDDGSLGEIWISLAKDGSTLKGAFSQFAIALSLGLQRGVPLSQYVEKFTGQVFEPKGVVAGSEHLKMASSIPDAIFRLLGYWYLGRDDLVQVPDAGHRLPPHKGVAPTIQVAHGVIAAAAVASTVPIVPGTSPAIESALAKGAVVLEEMGSPYTGDLCPECSSPRMVRSGTCARCSDCGATTGCS